MRKLILALAFLIAVPAFAQTTPTPPPDVPITHVSMSATFSGYDSGGKYIAANVDTFGIAIYRNAAATKGFNVAYEHIQVPALSERWEMGLGSYWFSLPKAPNILIDTSNFVVTLSGGAGKLLAPGGNHYAYTFSPSITYPIAGHMAWTVSYQYLHASGAVTGVLNKSYQSTSTGPLFYF